MHYDLKKVMEQFLIKKMFINELLQKGRNFHMRIKYIKRKFKDQYETRDEKLRVLKRLWDKMLRQFDQAAREIGNPRMKKLVTEL